ncbi:unnamed protein product [Caenorhabditis bovis]|uniref:IWS1-like protein n=1 Tax=Caenorhabditis bovis TaxID=2654633 RepID=A0A8S1FAP3_9PELO|nr:unnamed protein product [Caenorhabditis bovis]
MSDQGSPRYDDYQQGEVPASPDPQSPYDDNYNAPESPDAAAQDLYKDDSAGEVLTEQQTQESAESPPLESPESPPPQEQEEQPSNTSSKRAVLESDDDEAGASNKRALIESDASDDERPAKKKVVMSDESDDDDEALKEKKAAELFGDDSDNDDDNAESKTNQDDEDGEHEFEEKEEQEETGEQQQPAGDSDDDDGVIRDDDDDRRNGGFEWDFDIMLKQKKAERKRRVRRHGKDGGIDIINDDDGTISYLVERMKSAAKADRASNGARKPAFQKVKLLPEVKAMMMRAGIVEALVDNGFMSAISEWLAPLPDKSLPALDIRITLLKLLHNPRFWKLDRSTLKQSGLGKAVMLLYKHPSETKENKMIANKLIGEWARPIFQLDTDYSTLTREERLHRDFERMPEVKKKKLNINLNGEDDEREKRKPQIKEHADFETTSSGELRPGDKGYINRARVPKPSSRDYVVRPKWNVEGECKERKATGIRRYDQALREFQERTKKSKVSRAVCVSLEGRNLAI